MKWEDLKNNSSAVFKRLTGVSFDTFKTEGRKHDYRVFKESKVYVHHATKI